MQAVALRCPACGAALSFQESADRLICEFCRNNILIIRPLSANSIIAGLTAAEQMKYKNYLSILEQSMLAGNYSEAYDYCNKGLEINPNAAELWGNKAICSLWLNSGSGISEEEALEIITYLNACRNNDTDRKIYPEIAPSIADNLFSSTLYRYSRLKPDQQNFESAMTYSPSAEAEVMECIKIMQLCYRIEPNMFYLLEALRLVGAGKINWFGHNGGNSPSAQRQGFDAVKTREILLGEIRKGNTAEVLEILAGENYHEFAGLANSFSGIDRSLFEEMFVSLLNKYKPVKPPPSPEVRRRRTRNNIIFAGFVIGLLVILYLLVYYMG
jgi:tetratricopeptide (TPR) repeat protein